MPPSILGRHHLDRGTPLGKRARGAFRPAPPQTSLGRWGAAPHPNAREDSVESNSPRTDAEIEHLPFRWSKDTVLAPAGTPIITLGVALDEIILVVRSGHVPHPPFTIVIDQIWFIYASVFPVFIRGKGWFGLIDPLLPIPFENADCVWAPQVVGCAGVVNPLDPRSFGGVPSPRIRWAVPSPVAIPRPCYAAAPPPVPTRRSCHE